MLLTLLHRIHVRMVTQALGIFYENEGVGENIPNTDRVIVSARRFK